MNEIRFNQPVPTREIPKGPPHFGTTQPEFKTHSKKTWWKFLITLVLIVVLVIFGFMFVQQKMRSLGQVDTLNGLINGQSVDRYVAVFLLNGQVYFGKMVSNNEKEIILKEVYYLQASTASVGEAKKYDLIKLGTEVHGPTSEIFIIRSNVLFYEILRADSEVLRSIKNKN